MNSSNTSSNPEMSAADNPKVSFSFEPIHFEFKHETCPHQKELFVKWNLTPGLVTQKYQVEPCIMRGESEVVARDLFRDESILSNISNLNKDFVTNITFKKLSCQLTRMDIFNSFIEKGLISSEGKLMGCFDEDIEGILVQDKLRQALANDDNNSDIISPDVRNEFLYQLLKMVCVGGSMCQAETNFQKYKDTARDLYKDLVSIERVLDEVKVTSSVFHVDAQGQSGIFPVANMHNKCFVIVDEKVHTCTMIYKPYESFW